MFALVHISVVLLFFIGHVCGDGDSDERHHRRNIFFSRDDYQAEREEAMEKLYQTAIRTCPNSSTEIQEKLEKVKECSVNIDENQNTMCKVLELHLEKCLPPLVNLFEECLPKRSRDLPRYVLNTVTRLVEYLCDSDGAHLLELGNPCIFKKDHFDTRKCIRKLKSEADKYDHKNLPEGRQICMFVSEFKDCFVSHVDRSCKDPTTREAYKGIYETFQCKN